MRATILQFARTLAGASDWTQGELAEFYRVEGKLLSAGMLVQTDRGVSDEGDPWFVFCHAHDQQDVIIHFARLNGHYLVSTPDMAGIRTETDFRRLVQALLAQYEEIARSNIERRASKTGKVVLHPSAVLWTLVAIAFLKSAEARAQSSQNAVPENPPSHTAATALAADAIAVGSFATFASYAMQSVVIAWASGAGVAAGDAIEVAADSFHAWLHEDVSMAASFGHAALPTSLELAQATSSGGVVEPAPVMLAHWDDAGSQPAHNAADAIGTSVFKPAEVVNTAPASSPATPFVVVPDGHDHAGPVVDVGTHAPSLVSEAADVLLAAATGTSNGSTAGTAGQVVETVPYLPPSISTVLGHAVHVSGVSTVDASSAVAALTADAAHTATTISTTTDLSTVTAATASSNSVVSPSVSLTGASSSISSGSDTVATGTSGGDTAGSGTAGGGSAASGEHVAPVISHTITVAPAPVDALVTPITPVSVAFGSEPVAAAPASPVQDQATLALAVSSVHEFLIEVPLAKTVSTANTIVVYDPSVIDTAANHAQAVTFDFSDGSHISLIGLGSELTYALQGHA